MFESDFIEFFSRVHPAIPLLLYVPVIAYMVYVSLWQQKLSILAVTGLFLLGVLLWTLLEYLIHRYIFHYEPKTRLGKRLHYVIHGVHHDYPNDARRLVMPPSISVPLAFLFYGLFLLIFGHLASSVFAGLVFGYVCYDMLHYATHHFPMKRGLWLWLKHYHLRHHYKDDDAGFGISSPLWDYVFRTTRK
jgi:sterol desaturase/sphingolipid hydroxylase (fatty acid hydroxylase superfamily)